MWIKVSAFKPVLIQPPEPEQQCVDKFYIMAFTSGLPSAGADTSHAVEVTAKGNTRRQVLPNLPGDNYLENKGGLWELTMSSFNFPDLCIKKNDITNIAITQNNNDGWHIESITTLLKDVIGKEELVSSDLNINHWIDGDGLPDSKRLNLTLI